MCHRIQHCKCSYTYIIIRRCVHVRALLIIVFNSLTFAITQHSFVRSFFNKKTAIKMMVFFFLIRFEFARYLCALYVSAAHTWCIPTSKLKQKLRFGKYYVTNMKTFRLDVFNGVGVDRIKLCRVVV